MLNSAVWLSILLGLNTGATTQNENADRFSKPLSNVQKSWNFVANGIQQSEKTCLALGIYHEARGESVDGQNAVAKVILNRKLSRAYPNTICGVVYQNATKPYRCQFSFACDHLNDFPYNKASWSVSLIRAETFISKSEPAAFADVQPGQSMVIPQRPIRYGSRYALEKATHYHAEYVSPDWASELIPAGKVGRHLFYVSDRVLKKG